MKKTKYLNQIQTLGTVPRVATAKFYNIAKQEYLENIEVYKSRGFAFTPLQVTKHNILIAHFDQTSQIIDVDAYRKKKTKLAQLHSICAYGCIPSIKTAQKNELSCVEFENALNKYLGTQNISARNRTPFCMRDRLPIPVSAVKVLFYFGRSRNRTAQNRTPLCM